MLDENKLRVSVTLTAADWRAVLDTIEIGCREDSDGWLRWQEFIGRKIRGAINKANAAPPRRRGARAAGRQKNTSAASRDRTREYVDGLADYLEEVEAFGAPEYDNHGRPSDNPNFWDD
ncbi:hypothetical protein ACFLWA_10725 [Chloroflexota bacterium]